MLTSHTLKETRHRLISGPNLDLEVRRLVSITALRIRALNVGLLRVGPLLGTAEDVFLLFAREVAARVDGSLDRVLVGTGSTLEAVATRLHRRNREDVGTQGTDWQKVSDATQ